MKTENIVFEVIAASRSVSQKGDVSKQLLEQGFFDNGQIPEGLKRDPLPSGGNPVDVLKTFNDQQFPKQQSLEEPKRLKVLEILKKLKRK